ncbi:hypothetical protein AgCh_031844 [Apium graveolens]
MEESIISLVTPGEILGKASQLKAGKGAYVNTTTTTTTKEAPLVYASLTGLPRFVPPSPHSADQRPTVEVTGHKAHGAVPQPASIVIARVTKVMARMASADIMCVGPKSVREKFTGIISFLLEMHVRIIYQPQRMSWELYPQKVLQVQQWFQLVGQRCSAH